MTQFTANEVLRKLRERFTSGNSVPVPDIRLTRAEFDAFADLLEEREKAEPVAFRYQAQQVTTGAWVWSGWLDLGDPGIASLHVHCKTADPTKIEYAYAYAPPSGAERLAEALRNLVSEWVALADDGDATLEDSTIGYRACANRLSAMLAAHSAQAQPPAASVTDVLSKYHELLFTVQKKFPNEDRHATALRYIQQMELTTSEPTFDAQENPNG